MFPIRVKRISGFTLVELLVVISIIALLLSILMPSLSKARAQAKKIICRSHLKQIGLMNHIYASDNNSHFPIVQGGDLNGDKIWGDQAMNNPYIMGTVPSSIEMDISGLGRLFLSFNSPDPTSYDINPDIWYCPASRYYTKTGVNSVTGQQGWAFEVPGGRKGYIAAYHLLSGYTKEKREKLTDSGRKALVIDAFFVVEDKNIHNNEGANLLFIDESVSWVDDEVIKRRPLYWGFSMEYLDR